MIKVHIVSQEPGSLHFKGKIDLEMPNLPRRGEWLELVEGSTTTYYEVVHIVHPMASGNLDVSVFVKTVGGSGEPQPLTKPDWQSPTRGYPRPAEAQS